MKICVILSTSSVLITLSALAFSETFNSSNLLVITLALYNHNNFYECRSVRLNFMFMLQFLFSNSNFTVNGKKSQEKVM